VILPGRVLFVGAHCDDIELIAGGLLARACFSGRRVGTLVFSDHRGVVADTVAAQARAEFQGGPTGCAPNRQASATTEGDVAGVSGRLESQRSGLYAAMEAVATNTIWW
jgi:hypothetical protein